MWHGEPQGSNCVSTLQYDTYFLAPLRCATYQILGMVGAASLPNDDLSAAEVHDQVQRAGGALAKRSSLETVRVPSSSVSTDVGR